MLAFIAICVFIIMLVVARRLIMFLIVALGVLWLIGSHMEPRENSAGPAPATETASATVAPRPQSGFDPPAQPRQVLSEQGQDICAEKARLLGWSPEQVTRCFREKRTEERMMRNNQPRR